MNRRDIMIAAYAQALSMLPVPLRRRYLYYATFKRWPQLSPPRTFTEKVQWRIINDRRDLLAWTCSKLDMKSKVARLAPDYVRIPQTYWSGTDLRELASVDLPKQWVIKPNHRSSGVFHYATGTPNIAELTEVTRGWLDEKNWRILGEWAYKNAERCFVVEELIGSGTPPHDYRFLVFHGQVRVIQLEMGRGVNHTVNYYSPAWEPLPVRVGLPPAPPIDAPAGLDKMIHAAEAIAGAYDFLRVDLYNVDGDIWFGETTPYPGSGFGRYNPSTFDSELGSYWTLPTKATVKRSGGEHARR